MSGVTVGVHAAPPARRRPRDHLLALLDVRLDVMVVRPLVDDQVVDLVDDEHDAAQLLVELALDHLAQEALGGLRKTKEQHLTAAGGPQAS